MSIWNLSSTYRSAAFSSSLHAVILLSAQCIQSLSLASRLVPLSGGTSWLVGTSGNNQLLLSLPASMSQSWWSWEWKLSTQENGSSKSSIINDDRSRNCHAIPWVASQQQISEPHQIRHHFHPHKPIEIKGLSCHSQDEKRKGLLPTLPNVVDAAYLSLLPYQASLCSKPAIEHSCILPVRSQVQQNKWERTIECKTLTVCVLPCLPLVIQTKESALGVLCLELLVWWQSISGFTGAKGCCFRTGSPAIWRSYSPLAAPCLWLWFTSENLNVLVKIQRGWVWIKERKNSQHFKFNTFNSNIFRKAIHKNKMEGLHFFPL